MASRALFQGLIFDERERPVEVKFIGTDAHYVVDDDGFLRHIDAEQVDKQVLSIFVDQIQQNRDFAVSQTLEYLGKDDLFTKAALESSLDNVDLDAIIQQGVPEQARTMLGMMGFRIYINHHGEMVGMNQPTMPDDEE